MEVYYEHPTGYRPNAKELAQRGTAIWDMKKGDRFVASDGRTFEVTRPVVTTPCAGGVSEHDMWARVVGDLKSDTEFVFHCPVGANPLCFTYVLCNGKQPVPGRTDMYNYYKIENLSGPCPVYLCVGSNEDLTAFAADVEALGLETTIVRALPGENVCFAVDPLENRIHEVSLAAAIDLIINEGAIPQQILDTEENGPFPAERTFSIATVWQMYGRVRTTAKTLAEAMDQVIETEGMPQESSDLDESREIDYESGV